MKKEEQDALILEINKQASKTVQTVIDGFKTEMEKFKTEYAAIAEKGADGTYTKEVVDEKLAVLTKKSEGFNPEELKTLKTELDKLNEVNKELGRQVNKLEKAPQGGVRQGVGDVLKQMLLDADLLEEYVVDASISEHKTMRLKDFETRTKGQGAMTIKAAIDMTTPLALAPGETPGTNIGFLTDYGMRDVLINLTKDTHMVNILPTDPTSKQYIGVMIEVDYVDGAAVKAENTASDKSSIEFITKEFKVFDIPTHFKVSLNMLADMDRLVSKLNRIAPDKILSKFDERILSATGDNDSDIKGMFVAGNFTDFNAAEYEGEIQDANIIDLIRKMKLQAVLADQDVNAVILHPADIDTIEGYKDADKNFLRTNGIVFDNNGQLIRLLGLAIFRNKKIGLNATVVFWNEAAEIGIRQDVSFEIGTDGNDLTKRMRTIVFNLRAAFGVGKPGAIIYEDDISGALEVMNKVVVNN